MNINKLKALLIVICCFVIAMNKEVWGSEDSLSDTPFSLSIFSTSSPSEFAYPGQQGGKPDLDIVISPIVLKDASSNLQNFFCARGVFTNSPLPSNIKELPGVITSSVIEMEEVKPGEQLEFRTNRSSKDWTNFNAYLLADSSTQRRKIAGEVVAELFFDHLGYMPLPAAAYNGYHGKKKCITQNGSSHGIDTIFIHKSEQDTNISHIIINEAKYRDKMSLSKNDFGTISDGTIRQSHSFWNEAKFSIECIINGLGNYGSKPIIRTATLLTSTGEVKLYAVKNADEESYSINLPIFQNKILTAGYILQH